MKLCKKCGISKPPAEWYASITSTCKECWKNHMREYRVANIDRIQEYDRQRGLDPKRKAAVKKRAHRYERKKKQWVRAYQEANPERRAAHIVVGNAIRDGRLKVQPCERCGYGVGVHAHHEDYSKPLDVNWPCARCHGERHREINAERRRAQR